MGQSSEIRLRDNASVGDIVRDIMGVDNGIIRGMLLAIIMGILVAIITKICNNRPSTSPLGPSKINKPGLQLNDSVWELYKPKGDPAMTVIFFHGLQLFNYKEAFWRTWLCRDDSMVWPAEWLGPALNARILSISYDSSAQKATTIDMFQIIENLMQDIVLSPRVDINQKSKVILVGHSLGGLIIKQLLLKCIYTATLYGLNPRTEEHSKRLRTFLYNCGGIFYYATPHGGSGLTAFADFFKHFPFLNVNTPIIKFLRIMNSETARINDEFSTFRNALNVETRAAAELHATPLKVVSFLPAIRRHVVLEGSSRRDVDRYYSVAANHFEICKPENSTSNIYSNLRELCEHVVVGEAAREESVSASLPSVPGRRPAQTAPRRY